MDSELEELLSNIKADTQKPPLNVPTVTTNTAPTVSSPIAPLKEEDLTDFIIQKTQKLVLTGLDTVEDLKQTISQTVDSEEIAAFAEVVEATNKSIEILNKINLQNKKAKAAKEIKQMDLEGKSSPTQITGGNNNILIATREEILKQFTNNAFSSKKKEIEVEVQEEAEEPSVTLPEPSEPKLEDKPASN